MFGLIRSGRQRTQAPKAEQRSDQAFQQMEQRISRIHYYYCHADLSPDVRQVMTYRKLMELDYFTPQAAQALMRQWSQGV